MRMGDNPLVGLQPRDEPMFLCVRQVEQPRSRSVGRSVCQSAAFSFLHSGQSDEGLGAFYGEECEERCGL